MKYLSFVAIMALLFPSLALALPDTRITVQGTNVVLTWPSATGQTFLVQYRTNLDPATVWTTLTNGLASASGTNRTAFTHKGAATFIACTSTNGGNGGGGPPNPAAALRSGASAPISGQTDVEATTEPTLRPQPLLRAAGSMRPVR
jgi:hypothetical protein